MKAPYYQLMLVTQKGKQALSNYLVLIEQCLKAGVTSVQLREKHADFTELVDMGKRLKTLLHAHDATLIINDYVELARQIGADGVHLGQNDDSVSQARSELGFDKLIGVTIDNEHDLAKANYLPIDYVGVGAVFASANKPNVTTVWGLQGLSRLTQRSHHPVIAIGGINPANAVEVIKAGAHGIAVIGAIHDANYPKQVAHQLSEIIKHKDHHHAQ